MSLSHNSIRAVALLCGVGATVLVVGCNTDSASSHTAHSPASTVVTSTSVPSSAVAQHNSADVMFNQMMIPHHAQAVEMASLVDARTENTAVRQLAGVIRNAQQPEIDEMTARLTSWGQPIAMSGGHGGHRMTGMMSDDEMTALKAARGADFDRRWLAMMVRHHEGAVQMANAVLTDGVDSATRKLATAVKAAQTAEIAQMNKMLGNK